MHVRLSPPGKHFTRSWVRTNPTQAAGISTATSSCSQDTEQFHDVPLEDVSGFLLPQTELLSGASSLCWCSVHPALCNLRTDVTCVAGQSSNRFFVMITLFFSLAVGRVEFIPSGLLQGESENACPDFLTSDTRKIKRTKPRPNDLPAPQAAGADDVVYDVRRSRYKSRLLSHY